MRLSLGDEQLDLIEAVLDDWTQNERGEIAPRYEMLDGLEEVRFRAIDIPRRYRDDEAWKTETEDVQTVVYTLQNELERDAVPREVGFGYGDVVETSTDYDPKDDTLEVLHNDVAEVLVLSHKLGWTIQDFGEDNIFLKPATTETEVDDL